LVLALFAEKLLFATCTLQFLMFFVRCTLQKHSSGLTSLPHHLHHAHIIIHHHPDAITCLLGTDSIASSDPISKNPDPIISDRITWSDTIASGN